MSTARDHLGHELSAEDVIRHLAVMLGWANNAVVPWTVIERDIRELKARAEAAQRDFAACAHAIGVEYEAEGHASRPGPVEDVVSHIEQAAAASLELIDVKREVEQLRKELHDALGYVSDRHRRAHFARYLVNGELLSTLPATTPLAAELKFYSPLTGETLSAHDTLMRALAGLELALVERRWEVVAQVHDEIASLEARR